MRNLLPNRPRDLLRFEAPRAWHPLPDGARQGVPSMGDRPRPIGTTDAPGPPRPEEIEMNYRSGGIGIVGVIVIVVIVLLVLGVIHIR